ncbi:MULTISPECIES: hypothetical protein [Paraburkholderia]|uniref:hypothetical protein n=1 Tax=Paraburkholderia TaxID=1822464 RepID=UPI0022508C1B|nr:MULTISPECIES: hypothetical protein [Paraburkholderia]MCX4159287.1 hypothetical protein [Paraburkholderia aspalathi]MDN7168686.1 hypothetical protein [Paraburkholderia sp. SECH2]MDQ6397173.1 hypothetical protein [Paraburkholderia aspalathi]
MSIGRVVVLNRRSGWRGFSRFPDALLRSTTRPLAPDARPLLNKGYMVPTPSIGAMYTRILRRVRRGVSGAIIYGHMRWGKTYAIRYCVRLLREELPRTAILHLGMPQNPSHSESHFFGMLLAATKHDRPRQRLGLATALPSV